jgi:hypothetical protein
MRALRHLFFDIDRQLEDAARARQQLDAERWRDGLARLAKRLGISLSTPPRHSGSSDHARPSRGRFSGSPRRRQGSPLRCDPARRGCRP